VSDLGPTGDDEPDRNPFQGMPLFGDLAKLIQNQGPIAWDPARQFALSIATGGVSEPNLDPVVRMNLEQLARVAELQVSQAMGRSVSVQVVAVNRTQWTLRTLEHFKPLFERLAQTLRQNRDDESATDELDGLSADDPLGFLAPMMQMIEPMMLGMTAGSMVGHLAMRSFGQYDLPIPRPGNEIMLVPANIDEFGQEWSLPEDQLHLWMCLHEVAHHAVLSIPHVRDRLTALIQEYVAGFQTDPHALENKLTELDLSGPEGLAGVQNVFSDPEVLLGAIQSPSQRELLPRIEALVAVIAGYVDHLMDQIGSTLITSYDQVTEALRRRRVQADPSDRFVERLLGLELTQEQYDRGAAFVDGVLERAGPEGLARVWTSERELPTPAEVDAPGLWLARIDLPD
jgi:putative hydrolase